MQLYKLLADAQSQTAAATGSILATCRLVKGFKDALAILDRDSHAGIDDAHEHIHPLADRPNGDASLCGKAGRVAHQVEDHLADPRSVTMNVREAGNHIDLQPQPLHIEQWPYYIDRLIYHFLEIELLTVNGHLASFHLAEIKDVVDHTGQVLTTAMHDLHVLQEGLGQRPTIDAGRLRDQVDQADNQIERGAKLVAHLGHKGGLGLLGLLGQEPGRRQSLVHQRGLVIGLLEVFERLFEELTLAARLLGQRLSIEDLANGPFGKAIGGTIGGEHQRPGAPNRAQFRQVQGDGSSDIGGQNQDQKRLCQGDQSSGQQPQHHGRQPRGRNAQDADIGNADSKGQPINQDHAANHDQPAGKRGVVATEQPGRKRCAVERHSHQANGHIVHHVIARQHHPSAQKRQKNKNGLRRDA